MLFVHFFPPTSKLSLFAHFSLVFSRPDLCPDNVLSGGEVRSVQLGVPDLSSDASNTFSGSPPGHNSIGIQRLILRNLLTS